MDQPICNLSLRDGWYTILCSGGDLHSHYWLPTPTPVLLLQNKMPYQCTIPQQPIGLHLHFPEKAIAQKKQNNVAFPFSIGLQFDRREYYIRRLKNLRIYRYTVKKKNGKDVQLYWFPIDSFSYLVCIGAHFYCAYPHHQFTTLLVSCTIGFFCLAFQLIPNGF